MGPELAQAAALLRGRRIVALTGAGCSTESGIPDYRSPGTAPRRPIQHREFLQSEAARARYWARSAVGWPRLRGAQPNAGHRALAALERAGNLAGVLTQNVDRLHHAAGSQRVVELHGAIAEVICLGCGALTSRDEVQARLLAQNPGLALATGAEAPDGDMDLGETPDLRVPACLACGEVLKPHVVFFGDNVPPPRLAQAWALLDEGDALLVAGTSLTVFSGYRFVRRAAERGLPVVILNRGPTRGDPLAQVCWDAATGEALPALAAVLSGCALSPPAPPPAAPAPASAR